MKRFLPIACLLCAWCVQAPAQSKEKARFLIDSLFFSERPSCLEGRACAISILEKEDGSKMLYISGAQLDEKARRYAIPTTEVPDAEYWLKEARTVTHFYQLREETPAELALKVGDRIGDFEVKDTEGRTWTRQNTQGKPLVLNFWYTGCGPCIKEMPELSTWVVACPEVNFLAVTWNTADEIQSIVQRRGFRFVQVTGDKSLWKMFGVQQTPTTIVLDKEGVVRKIVLGTNQQKRDELLECIKSLM